MTKTRLAVCLLCCSLMLIGCATTRIQAPPLLPTNAYPFVAEASQAKVAVDPYFTKPQTSQVFGQDLENLDILPVWTVIDNQGKAPISLPREQAYLVSPGGKVYPAIKADAILPALREQRESAMGGAAATMGLVGALTFLALTSTWSSGEQKNLERLVQGTTWLEKEVPPGERQAGFLYFDLPGSPTSLDGYTLRFEISPKDDTPQKVELPLHGKRK